MILFVFASTCISVKAVHRQFFITFWNSFLSPSKSALATLNKALSFPQVSTLLVNWNVKRVPHIIFASTERERRSGSTNITRDLCVKIYSTWTQGSLYRRLVTTRISFRHTKRQSNPKAKGVLRSLYLIYLRTCAYVSPCTHRFVIAKLNCVTHKQNEMKESVCECVCSWAQTAALIVIPSQNHGGEYQRRQTNEEWKKELKIVLRLQSVHNTRDNNIVKLYSHARCPRAQNAPRVCVVREWIPTFSCYFCNSLNNETMHSELNYLVI